MTDPTQPGQAKPDQPDLNLQKPATLSGHVPPAPDVASPGYSQPQRPQQPYIPPYNPYAVVPLDQRLSGLALAGFIVAVASPLLYFLIVPAPVGLVLSIIGLVRDVNGLGMRGRGFAIAGIVVSAVVIVGALLIFAGLIIYGLSHPYSSSYCDQRPYAMTCEG